MLDNKLKIYKHLIKILIIIPNLLILTSCSTFSNNEDNEREVKKEDVVIPRDSGLTSKAISLVYTSKPELTLSFNGMADEMTMKRLLDVLDMFHIKATFFLPGMRVAEEPNIAKNIVEKGHEIENNTLNKLDMNSLDYEQIYKDIYLSNKVIKKETGVSPIYIRTTSADINEMVRRAAAQNGLKAVISSSLFLHNWQGETSEEKSKFIRKYINRGGIITIDVEENKDLIETVTIVANEAKEVGYNFVQLKELIANGGERKPLEQIDGYNAANINLHTQNTAYDIIYRQDTQKKVVVLSFDDWGTDYTISKILNILKQYDIKASFFLRADGVEKNPNLARAIAEEGHDVGNHSYRHSILSTLSAKQIQEDIVKAHRVITEAIQQKPTMLFRTPTGEINEREASIIAATGYRVISLYDVDPNDWNRKISSSNLVSEVQRQVKNGSIILLHSLDNLNTIEALPRIIESLEHEGYSFVRLSDLMNGN